MYGERSTTLKFSISRTLTAQSHNWSWRARSVSRVEYMLMSRRSPSDEGPAATAVAGATWICTCAHASHPERGWRLRTEGPPPQAHSAVAAAMWLCMCAHAYAPDVALADEGPAAPAFATAAAAASICACTVGRNLAL